MRDRTASGSFRALAEAINLSELAKTRYGQGSLKTRNTQGSLAVFAPGALRHVVREIQDMLFRETATLVAAH